MMTLETFFEKFDLFADAPDAVAKMRELVLQLAVQGKLVDQKKDDGSAANLLAAIERERNARKSTLRTPEAPSLCDGDDQPFELPENWTWTKLGNIALQIQYGYTATADPLAAAIRMLRITDIQNDRVNWPSVPGCQIHEDEAEKYLLSANDILIARTGGTIGKSFIVPDAPVKSVFASYLIRVTPPRSMDARYLKIFLGCPFYWRQLREMSAGTGQPNVNGQALGRLEIPLPPLAEQKRIVAKVDELIALCDRLALQQEERETRHAALARASLARFAEAPTPANLQWIFHQSYAIPPAALRKAILTLAVQGHLKSQSDELGFPQVRLDSLGSWAQGCGFPLAEQGHTDRPILFSKVSDMNLSGNEREIHKTNHTIDEAAAKRLRIKVHPPGTVIFPKIGGAIATNKRRVLVRPTAIDNNCSGIIPNKSCSTAWVFLVLSAIDFAEYQSGTSVPAVNQGALGEIEVSLPPLAEQRRIVAKVDELMASVDALETQLATARTTATALLAAALAELTSRA